MGKYDAYKEQVLKVTRALWEQGYFGTRTGSGGNVSVHVEGEEAVVVTPSGKPYGDLTPDDICVVNYKLDAIDAKWDASVETPMHIAVYKNRKDVNAVVHTHQPYATMFGLINHPIPALFDEVAISIGNIVDIVPYGLSGSGELLANVVAKLSNRCHCYILQNHGALCIGKNLDKAYHYAELLEKTARIYHGALAMGKPVTLLPDEIQEGLFGLVKGSQDIEISRKEEAEKG